MKWHTDDIIEVLRIYEQYSALWNMKDKEYFNAKMKPEVFLSLYHDLEKRNLIGNMDMRQMKAKIKSIKDVHRQELYKILESKKKGDKEVYTPKLAWFKEASFLAEVSGTRPLYFKKNLQDRPQYIQESEHGESTESFLASVGPVNNCSASVEPASNYPEEHIMISSTSPSTSRGVKRTAERSPQVSPNRLSEKDNDDPYDQFGMYVAAELRQLPLRQAILLQQEIQRSITNAKLAYLNHPNYLDPNQVLKVEFAASPDHSFGSQSVCSNERIDFKGAFI